MQGNCVHDSFVNYNYSSIKAESITKGISLTSSYSRAIYHSIIEGLSKYMPFYNSSLERNQSLILSKLMYKSRPAYEILKFIGIVENRIVFTPVIAKELIIPLPGTCLYAIKSNIIKFNRILIDKLKHEIIKGKMILLIKRSRNRIILNFNETKSIIQNIYVEYRIEVYDDSIVYRYSNTLMLFYQSSIIIGVHGAGFSNILACRRKTIIIEIATNRLVDCFKNLSQQLDLIFYRYIFDKSIKHTAKIPYVKLNLTDFRQFLVRINFIKVKSKIG